MVTQFLWIKWVTFCFTHVSMQAINVFQAIICVMFGKCNTMAIQ